jgi:hypothetical protein
MVVIRSADGASVRLLEHAGRLPAVRTSGGGKYDDAIKAIWLAIPLIYACFFDVFRGLGSPAFIVAAGALASFGLLYGRRYIQAPLIFFAALAASYAALSYVGALDRGLTLLFDRSAIAQQSAYAITLPFIIPAFAVYHEAVHDKKRAFLILQNTIFILALASKFWYFLSPAADPVTGESLRIWAGLTQFVNLIAILAFMLVHRTLEAPGRTMFERRTIAILLLVTSASSQATIAMITLVGMMILPRVRRLLAGGFVVLMAIIPIIAWPFAQEIWVLDPNTGIRLFFWHDAVDRVLASGGIGVGFGTETIRPVYALDASDVTLVGIDDPGFIFIGSHNAFVDAGYRLGVIGFFVLILYFGSLFRRVLRQPDASVMDCWVVCAIVTVLMVNVGMASINFLFGTVFFIGWLVYRVTVLERPNVPTRPEALPASLRSN